MKTTGKIVGVDVDYVTHKIKITLEVGNKELVGLEEIRNLPLIDITLEKHREKRSLNANNYAWTLIQQLADKLGTTKEQVYREYIKHKGIFKTITITNKAVKTFTHLWTEKGIGWLCEPLNEGETMTDLICYYGTSSYNTKQMANFIDYIVEEAKEQGIETLTPEQLSKMKEEWK